MIRQFIGPLIRRRTDAQLTTTHLAALYPFMSERGLSSGGTYLGNDHAGGPFALDEFTSYSAGEIPGINSVVIGEIGSAKSTLQKLTIWRASVRGAHGPDGRSFLVLDPKQEYHALHEALNRAAAESGREPVSTIIRLAPGREGTARLNPLATNGGRERQQALLSAVVGSALERSLTPTEQLALVRALEEFEDGGTLDGQEPTLPHIARLLLEPTERMSHSMRLDPNDLAERCRDASYALGRLIDGDLSGMFDGPTSEGLDLDHQVVILDLSAVEDSSAIGIIMTCAMAWMDSAIAAEIAGHAEPRKRMMIVDEAWRVLANNLPCVEYLAANAKLSRTRGVATRLCFHRLSDMRATGEDGSRVQRLAEGLISDSQIKVIYRQDSAEIEHTRQVLGLTHAEADLLTELPVGMALWKFGSRSLLVNVVPGSMEWEIVDTDSRMRRDRELEAGRGGPDPGTTQVSSHGTPDALRDSVAAAVEVAETGGR